MDSTHHPDGGGPSTQDAVATASIRRAQARSAGLVHPAGADAALAVVLDEAAARHRGAVAP